MALNNGGFLSPPPLFRVLEETSDAKPLYF